jgi:hypothetical protein
VDGFPFRKVDSKHLLVPFFDSRSADQVEYGQSIAIFHLENAGPLQYQTRNQIMIVGIFDCYVQRSLPIVVLLADVAALIHQPRRKRYYINACRGLVWHYQPIEKSGF